MTKKYFILTLLFSMSLAACSEKEEVSPENSSTVPEVTQESESENENSDGENNENSEVSQKVETGLFLVDSTKCKTSPLAVKEFKSDCKVLSELKLNPEITAKAVQIIPEDKKDEDMLDLGDMVAIEFYKNGEKMDIPEKTFNSSWTTDFLSLGVAFKDESNIMVYGNAGADKPEYNYTYDGKTWTQTK